MTGLPQQVIRCPDCQRVLLLIYDADAPDLPAEMAEKVDGHRCQPPADDDPTSKENTL